MQEGPLGIQVLTSGPIPPNPSDLLGSLQMAELINGLRARSDVVILDSVAVLPVADTLALQRYVDGVVLVLDTSRTGTKVLERCLLNLRQASARVLGVVLNKDRGTGQSYSYGYGYDHQWQEPGLISLPDATPSSPAV